MWCDRCFFEQQCYVLSTVIEQETDEQMIFPRYSSSLRWKMFARVCPKLLMAHIILHFSSIWNILFDHSFLRSVTFWRLFAYVFPTEKFLTNMYHTFYNFARIKFYREDKYNSEFPNSSATKMARIREKLWQVSDKYNYSIIERFSGVLRYLIPKFYINRIFFKTILNIVYC